MSDTADSPLRRRQISRAELSRRKLREDIKRNLNTAPECDCRCHTQGPGSGDAHVGERCPCKATRRRLV